MKFRDRIGERILYPAALVLAGVLLGLPATGGASGEGEEHFYKMRLAALDKNYTGRKMVIDFSRLTPQVKKFTVTHLTGGKERREYPAPLGIMVIDGSNLWQYYPEKKLVVKRKLPGEKNWESLQKENLKQTFLSYEVKKFPADRIANHRSRLYEFRPRQAGSRPLRKIWVDVETGLVLRTEIYRPDNKLGWLSVFEALEYRHDLDPSSFTFRIPAGVSVVESHEGRCLSPAEAEQAAGLPLALPRYVPEGFVRKCVRARRSQDYGEIQVVFSDGLSLLSLFGSSRFHPPARSASVVKHAIEVGTFAGEWYDMGLVTVLGWRPPWAHQTLLGEVSREELLKIAESIRPAGKLFGTPGHP